MASLDDEDQVTLAKADRLAIGVLTDTLKEDTAALKAMTGGPKKMKLRLAENIEEMTHPDAPDLVIISPTTQEVKIKLKTEKIIVNLHRISRDQTITVVLEEIVAVNEVSDLSVTVTILKTVF